MGGKRRLNWPRTSAEIQCWTKAERSSFRCFAGHGSDLWRKNTGPCHASILGSAYGRRSRDLPSLKTVKGGMMEPILLHQTRWSVIALRSLEEDGFDFEDYDDLSEALNVPPELVNTFGRRATLRSSKNKKAPSLHKAKPEI